MPPQNMKIYLKITWDARFKYAYKKKELFDKFMLRREVGSLNVWITHKCFCAIQEFSAGLNMVPLG